jgi:cysteine desulfurase family protein (TIGR01976 family)
MNDSVSASTECLPVEWVREQFPALASSGVLMDNAGGSAPLGRVADRVAEYMRRWPVQLGASYRESATASGLLDDARAAIAGMMGASPATAPDPGELVVGASTSSLLSRLARSLATDLDAGDEIVVTDVDHEANISPWRRLENRGLVIRTWRLNRDTLRLEIDDLLPLLSDRTRLVCFTHASNILGEVTPVAEITRIVHERGARVCVDGVAYAPHRALDVRAWDVDFYAFSLYKVYGPHCAVLYCRKASLDSLVNLNHLFMEDYEGPVKLEPGAFPYELLYGAAGVPDYLGELGSRTEPGGGTRAAYAAMEEQERRLSRRLLAFLDACPAVEVLGPGSDSTARLPTISFAVANTKSSAIPPVCDRHGIGIRWGHFYAPQLVERLGLSEKDGVVRVSMVHYNTQDEVDRLIAVLGPALEGRLE